MEAMGEYFFNLRVMQKALPALLSGLGVTVKVSVLIILIGFVVGLLLAIVGTLRVRYLSQLLNVLIRFYVDILRSCPYLVLVILVYYGTGFMGINLSSFWATVLTFGACLSAFAEESFRAGIEAINRGQVEAARALGLTHLQVMRYVILPWALVVTIPTLTNRGIAITKAVSMASAIALPDLLKQARSMQAVYANPTPLIEAAVIYVLLFFPLVQVAMYLERRTVKDAS